MSQCINWWNCIELILGVHWLATVCVCVCVWTLCMHWVYVGQRDCVFVFLLHLYLCFRLRPTNQQSSLETESSNEPPGKYGSFSTNIWQWRFPNLVNILSDKNGVYWLCVKERHYRNLTSWSPEWGGASNVWSCSNMGSVPPHTQYGEIQGRHFVLPLMLPLYVFSVWCFVWVGVCFYVLVRATASWLFLMLLFGSVN